MTTVFKLADKVSAFKAKSTVGTASAKGHIRHVSNISNIVPFGERKLGPSLSKLICDHIALLSAESERYFPNASDPRTDKEWVRDPFANVPYKSSMLVRE